MTPLPIDREICDLVAALYAATPQARGPFAQIIQVAGHYIGLAPMGNGGLLVAERGSFTGSDYGDDLLSVRPLRPPEIAPAVVGDGFWAGAEEAADALAGSLPRGVPLYMGCHSLGCPRGVNVALRLAQKYDLHFVRVVLFESPRQGDAAFRDLVTAAGLPGIEYSNEGDDIVAAPPFELEIPPMEFVHCFDQIALHELPQAGDWNPIWNRHHIWLDQAGLAKLFPDA